MLGRCNNEAECRVAIFAAIEDSVAAGVSVARRCARHRLRSRNVQSERNTGADAVRMRSNEATLSE